MRLIVTGARGQLGMELTVRGASTGWQVTGVDLPAFDICAADQVKDLVSAVKPDVLINAAAYTAVDRAEAEPDEADRVNHHGPDRLASACAQFGAALVHVSTDFVFDGRRRTPYTETEAMAPLSVYGRTKRDGEAAVRARIERHLIVRTAWLYATHGKNFVRTMLTLARRQRQLRVVADQYGSPTCAADLADALLTAARLAVAHDGPWGTYHFCGAGVTSWHGLAEAVIEVARPRTPLAVEQVVPIGTAEYPTAARRPAYSALNCAAIGRDFGIRPRPWLEPVKETVGLILAAERSEGKKSLDP